jgi:hypothetical protein
MHAVLISLIKVTGISIRSDKGLQRYKSRKSSFIPLKRVALKKEQN